MTIDSNSLAVGVAAFFLLDPFPGTTSRLSSASTEPPASLRHIIWGRDHHRHRRRYHHIQLRRLYRGGSGGGRVGVHGAPSDQDKNSFTSEEEGDMEDLILSLSKVTSDESRRDRLATIFAEELAKPNGQPKHFTDLFDRALISVGDRVQVQAQQQQQERWQQKLQQEERNGENGDGEIETKAGDESAATADDGDEERSIIGKTPEEKQLWALVDMMVQSKTIVKRASGELGSRGRFG